MTFYCQDFLHIEPSKLKSKIALNNSKTYLSYKQDITCILQTFEMSPCKQNIVISGLGMLALKNIEKIEIFVPEHTNVNLLKKQII